MSNDQLKSIIDRIERLEEEKKALADDIREIYAEAKSNGFDVKALRAIVRIRKQDADERREQEAVIETYLHALGMLADTPLGESARKRAVQNSRGRLKESMADTAAVAQEAADMGLISQKAAEETRHIARAVTEKFAPRQVDLEEAIAAKTPPPVVQSVIEAVAAADGLDIPPFLRRAGSVTA